jgi:hypothetical protein
MAWFKRFRQAVDKELSAISNDPPVFPGESPGEFQDADTGPVRPVRRAKLSNLWSKNAAPVEDDSHLTPLEKQRKLIDSFHEDQLDWADRWKLKAAKGVAIVLPLIAIYAIGGELGQYFAGNVGFSWSNQWVMSQYIIGYAGETALAAMTYVLGHAFTQKAEGSGHTVKLAVTALVWFVFLAASAAGQWYVAVATIHPDPSMQLAIQIRIGMACSLDIASVCLMWWRGRSLGHFLEQQQKKVEAIRAVNESELAIQAAQDAAARRRSEDEEYQRAKNLHNQMVVKIQEMQTAAMVKQAEQNLLGGGGGSYGSARDRSNW